MLRASSPEEAYRKLDELAGRHVERLRRLTKQLQDARLAHDSEATKAAISAYEEALEGYIPGGLSVGPSVGLLLSLRSAGAYRQTCPSGSGTAGRCGVSGGISRRCSTCKHACTLPHWTRLALGGQAFVSE